MGILYIVSTPIGNLGDITFRAIETLSQCDAVVCEDTRITGKLLSHYDIKKEMLAFNEFNEEERVFDVLGLLSEGKNVALVTDSGTPLVSDPGYRLVSLARIKKIEVVPIPGATAAIAALSASGLPTNNFLFLGFLPKKDGKRENTLKDLHSGLLCLTSANINPTVIIYESPHRLAATLYTLKNIFGDITVTVAREITKIHEEFVHGRVSVLAERYEKDGVRGEISLLFNLKSSQFVAE